MVKRMRFPTVTMMCVTLAATLASPGHPLLAAGPQVLITAEQRPVILEKIQQHEWAGTAFAEMKERIDKYVAKVQEDPKWATSRLAMNWDTHYVQAVVRNARTVGGKGRAPSPTPRFAGARDWKTDYSAGPIDDLIPFNDQGGKIRLLNTTTKQVEWVEPAITGHAIETINKNLMGLAQDAAFLYWVTGEKKYAEFAAPILWTYMNGLSQVKPPLIEEGDDGARRIIGTTSYEVIHDGILEPIALTYDFLRDYIKETPEIDAAVIERGIKVIIDRVTAGGGAEGNWNIHQASKIAYGGLALQPNSAYEDGKGREYYIDIVLNARLPNQKGLTHVIKENVNAETGLWPEAAGYAFDSIANVIELASLVAADPAGQKVMDDPVLVKALLAMRKILYPNGRSSGLGDTDYTRLDARAYELMTAWCVKKGNTDTARTLAAALRQEVAAGAYSRSEPKDELIALTQYVGELPEADAGELALSPTYDGAALNLIMQRNVPASGDPRYALAAGLFGTRGGHVHANGMALELYGAGHILGVDPGRGSSYWQPDHREYYLAPPAHNTVIVNGKSNYPSASKNRSEMLTVDVEAVEPAFGEEPENKNFSYVTGKFAYPALNATQRRTVALVRIDDTTGFYLDVFRSRVGGGNEGQYHDWLFHSMGDRVVLTDVKAGALSTAPSDLLTAAKGNLKGYDYFRNEASAKTDGTVRASFPAKLGNDEVALDLWLVGGPQRQIFTVDAPGNRAARHNYADAVWDRPRPALIVRKTGEAWDQPFVVVYEPYLQKDGAKVRSVEAKGENTWVVAGDGWSAEIMQSDAKLAVQIRK